jgi:hypothetical protein
MGDEAVDPGSDVEVLGRTPSIDLARGPKILVKIMSAGNARTCLEIRQDGKGISPG